MNNLIIIPIAGLCNRLRVIFSYYQQAISEQKKLVVLWRNEIDCNGFFLDYFEQIPHVSFYLEDKYDKNDKHIHYTGFSQHPQFKPDYSFLKLKKNVRDMIDNVILKLGKKYISIHIRGMTEFKCNIRKNSLKPTTFNQYENFIHKYPNHNLYIAVDNKRDQQYLYHKYKHQIPVIFHIKDDNEFRSTTLLQAIIDLYVCISSMHFYRTKYSSFSDFILENRCFF